MDGGAMFDPWRRCLTAAADGPARLAHRVVVSCAVLGAVLLAACSAGPGARRCACEGRPCASAAAYRRQLALASYVVPTTASGLSGLARADDGTLWSLPEDHRALLAFRLDASGRPGQVTETPLVGVSRGVDTESLAWLGPGELAIGTERMRGDSDQGDEIDRVRVEAGRARVHRRIVMPYARWGMRAIENTGIEGLCAASGVLLAGVEHPGIDPVTGRRFANVGRMALAGSDWTRFRVWLTSDEGRLSSLDCRAVAGRDDVLDVLGVERHFGIARVLRFRVPVSGRGGDLVPKLVADLSCAMDELPNVEGVAWLDAERVGLQTDNDYGGPDGPSRFLVFRIRP